MLANQGFGESMAGLVGLENNNWAIRGFAAGAVLLLGIINVAGVKWVIKLQFLLSLILLCAGLNFMVGSFIGEDPSKHIFSVTNFVKRKLKAKKKLNSFDSQAVVLLVGLLKILNQIFGPNIWTATHGSEYLVYFSLQLPASYRALI